jgi:hypothetical protein
MNRPQLSHGRAIADQYERSSRLDFSEDCRGLITELSMCDDAIHGTYRGTCRTTS